MPETLFTNSPREIRAFLARQGDVVYKPLGPVGWRDGDRYFSPYTVLLPEQSLVSDAVLRQTPGIFQKLVPKAYELRVTMIGSRVFAAKVLSQQTNKGKLDWRRAYDELRFEPTQLPPEVAEIPDGGSTYRDPELIRGVSKIATIAREEVTVSFSPSWSAATPRTGCPPGKCRGRGRTAGWACSSC